MKISEMIKALENIEKEHGNLEIYAEADGGTYQYSGDVYPQVVKTYYRRGEDAKWMKGYLDNDDFNKKDEELYDVDLTKPIIKGVVI